VSAPNKSFFSGLHGVITGLAALTTAGVAVLGLAINQGWLSGHQSGGGSGGAGTTASTAVAPQYAVDPSSVVFSALGSPTEPVTVSNVGSVLLTVERPRVIGPGASHFSASAGSCQGSVSPGASCQIQVTFKHASGTFNATLVIQVTGVAAPTTIPISATAIL
jgi:hypothetical protein